jgi:hypothetical protein
MRIIVQLHPEATRAAAGPRNRWPRDLLNLERILRAPLEPLHPNATDPDLQTFFTVEIADTGDATPLLDTLRRHPLVTAAYHKPAEELP